MKPEGSIYLVVETWDTYSDYEEHVIYATDSRKDALDKAEKQHLIANSQCLAKELADDYSGDFIDLGSAIVLRKYPFKADVSDMSKAERSAYHIDENVLYKAQEANGNVNGNHFKCYLFQKSGAKR